MKNKLLGVFILLAVLLLAACNNDEPENIDTDYPTESESANAVISFDASAKGEADISGAWVYVKSTTGDDDAPLYIGEFTIIPPTVLIHEDNTLSARFWGTTINGVVTANGDNAFMLTERTVTVYGEPVDFLDEVMLQYDAESGLLRWTRFNQFSDMYEHDFFARSHPFAVALSEYIASADHYVRAYLATLDDDGTIGVLITSPTISVFSDYWGAYIDEPLDTGTLFYIQDGALHQIDVSSGIFVSGRYNRLIERFYMNSHTAENIYKLESGRLEVSTRLEYYPDDFISMLFEDDDTVEETIAVRDALIAEAREKYGLVALPPPADFWHMRNTANAVDHIMAMTINCDPHVVMREVWELPPETASHSQSQTQFIRTHRIHPNMPVFTFIRTATVSEHQNDWGLPFYDVVIDILDADNNLIQQISGLIQETTPYNNIDEPIMELSFIDLNFDGYLDMRLFSEFHSWRDPFWGVHYHWLWDSTLGMFVLNQYLTDNITSGMLWVDEDIQTWSYFSSEQAGTVQFQLHYAYIDGEFIEVRRQEWREFYHNDIHPADIIGNWHDMPMVAAGFGDRYSFSDDGTFIFASNEMDGTAREIAFSGSWEMADGQVVLTIKNRLMLIGGNLAPASGSIGTAYEIVGGRADYVRLPVEAFEVVIYEISGVGMDTIYGIGQIRSVWINGQKFWDFSHSDDLFDFYFSNRDAVFPE